MDLSDFIYNNQVSTCIPRATICGRLIGLTLAVERGPIYSPYVGPMFYYLYLQYMCAVEQFCRAHPEMQRVDMYIIKNVMFHGIYSILEDWDSDVDVLPPSKFYVYS